jgi:DNA-binding beta-propeller fold protein YncE
VIDTSNNTVFATVPGLSGPEGVAVSPDGSRVYVTNSGRVSVSVISSPPATTPSAPTALVATPGDGSASIAFTSGANGRAAITKYQYKVGNGSWTDAVGTSSPITVSGLTNFVTASIRLRAVNSVGNGAASVAVSVTPRLAGPMAASATPSGSTGIVVTFNLNPLPGTTVSYQSVVAYARGTNTLKGSCRTYGKQRTCFIGGLTRSTDYDLRVTAHLPVPGKTWHNATAAGSILQVRTNR